MKPRKPARISVYAEECLLALSREGLGRDLALGGAFGLSYFYEYRETHRVDAWWNESAVIQQRERVERCIARALSKFGAVRHRSWGDVLSLELLMEEKPVFGFQIARRDARLEEPAPAPWPQGLLLDSFPDLLASKWLHWSKEAHRATSATSMPCARPA